MNLKFDVKHDVLRYCWTIPLVPVNRFEEATQEILVTLNDNSELYDDILETLQKFVTNVEEFLSTKSTNLSFNDRPDEAINITENFSRHVANNLGGNKPDIFRYLERIRRVNIDSLNHWNQLEDGASLFGLVKHQFVAINSNMAAKLSKLQSGELTM
ncbi:uncharacterized protein LOC123273331 [Cotesia glomerata]|uniref:Uncharacterized protein n=1 Tax=Cotesia glomerata TaxID=32391 RepID=A0AAV7IZB2_COTGL|nr:uncharacterized protein LOC123273331 [Cotesia glomerata]KAH0563723.1 hypothetical protein KQX54_005078 [Cotesia glomerata]